MMPLENPVGAKHWAAQMLRPKAYACSFYQHRGGSQAIFEGKNSPPEMPKRVKPFVLEFTCPAPGTTQKHTESFSSVNFRALPFNSVAIFPFSLFL